MSTLPPLSEMERAVTDSDAGYDGIFFVAVRTTGIFCRPTCPARKPLPRNVEYFVTAKEALAAGYRPCKRCHPMRLGAQPEWLNCLLAEIDKNPTGRITESGLRARGIDPATVRRHF